MELKLQNNEKSAGFGSWNNNSNFKISILFNFNITHTQKLTN